MQGALRFRISHDGVWGDLPVDANDAAKRTSGLAACVAGGLVTGLGTVTDASGPQGGTRAPVGYGTTDDLIADAVGIDSTGGVLLSLPPSENRPPQVIGGSSTLRSKIKSTDRWAGMSADRHHVLLGNASGARIVTVSD